MADSLVTLSSPRGTLVFKETAATSTLEQNVFNKVGAVLYGIKVDATGNPGEDVFLAIYENDQANASGITVGTHHPVTIVKCAAGSTVEVVVPCGIGQANDQYFHACVKTTAGTAGNTSPSGTVSFTLLGE
jgi:membrane protease subunit (stomatin/prohibitin family)|tara:strand:+ start:2593 stop:2985 length:393 start_codon:yes stop_codon:yes gene_type:complete